MWQGSSGRVAVFKPNGAMTYQARLRLEDNICPVGSLIRRIHDSAARHPFRMPELNSIAKKPWVRQHKTVRRILPQMLNGA